MGSFGPSPLEVAVLLGWTVIGAVREKLTKFEAKLRPRPSAGDETHDEMPRINMLVPAVAAPNGRAPHLLN
jgi:hypothetical protein